MNSKSKMKMLMVLGLGTLIWSGVGAPAIAADSPATMPQSRPVSDATSKPSAPPSSAATQASKKPTGIRAIVAEVQALGGNGIPSSAVFAKELVAVLGKHKIPLPDGLGKLVVPKPPVPKPTEADVSRVYRQTHRIVSICHGSTWTRTADFGVSVSLRNDLLVTVAKHCPSSLARVEAVDILVKRAMPPGGDGEVPDVSPVEASKALEAVIMHILDVSSGSLGPDSLTAIRWAHGFVLCAYSVHLKAMSIDKPTKDALDKYVAAIDAKVAAAQKVVRGESARKTLEGLRAQVKRIGSATALTVQVVSLMNEVRPVVKAFIVAVNKEDKRGAAKYLTAKKQSLWAKEKSLRATFTNSPNTKEVRFVALGHITTLGKQFMVSAHVVVIDDRGRSTPRALQLYLTKTDKGWLLGQE